MPGVFRDHADGQTIGRICAAVQILDESSALQQVECDSFQERIEPLCGNGTIDLSPVNQVVCHQVVHGELVFGAATGARACISNQSAIRCEAGLASQQCSFNQLGNGEVDVNLWAVRQSLQRFVQG